MLIEQRSVFTWIDCTLTNDRLSLERKRNPFFLPHKIYELRFKEFTCILLSFFACTVVLTLLILLTFSQEGKPLVLNVVRRAEQLLVNDLYVTLLFFLMILSSFGIFRFFSTYFFDTITQMWTFLSMMLIILSSFLSNIPFLHSLKSGVKHFLTLQNCFKVLIFINSYITC